ncbi:MAG: hypothetical protein ACF8LK_08655, partial [Phycisphaerales bacterium JB041]
PYSSGRPPRGCPDAMPHAATVHIRSESEVPQGWRYVVEIDRPDGPSSTHRVRLSWVDHNHCAGERPFPPSRVVQALLEGLLHADPGIELPDRFDAATARRWVDDIDSHVLPRL